MWGVRCVRVLFELCVSVRSVFVSVCLCGALRGTAVQQILSRGSRQVGRRGPGISESQ